MDKEEAQVEHTQHAFLVAWGWFTEHIGLIPVTEKVKLLQKRYIHTPRTKVLELLVAILAGLKYCRKSADPRIPWISTSR